MAHEESLNGPIARAIGKRFRGDFAPERGDLNACRRCVHHTEDGDTRKGVSRW